MNTECAKPQLQTRACLCPLVPAHPARTVAGGRLDRRAPTLAAQPCQLPMEVPAVPGLLRSGSHRLQGRAFAPGRSLAVAPGRRPQLASCMHALRTLDAAGHIRLPAPQHNHRRCRPRCIGRPVPPPSTSVPNCATCWSPTTACWEPSASPQRLSRWPLATPSSAGTPTSAPASCTG